MWRTSHTSTILHTSKRNLNTFQKTCTIQLHKLIQIIYKQMIGISKNIIVQ